MEIKFLQVKINCYLLVFGQKFAWERIYKIQSHIRFVSIRQFNKEFIPTTFQYFVTICWSNRSTETEGTHLAIVWSKLLAKVEATVPVFVYLRSAWILKLIARVAIIELQNADKTICKILLSIYFKTLVDGKISLCLCSLLIRLHDILRKLSLLPYHDTLKCYEKLQ